MSVLNILRLTSTLACLALSSFGCGAAPSLALTVPTDQAPTEVQPTPDPPSDPAPEAIPVLVPIVQPSPDPTPSPSPSPNPSPSPTPPPVTLISLLWSNTGICQHLEHFDPTTTSIKLRDSSNGYYYLFSAAGVTVTTINVDGSDGVTSEVGELVQIFTLQQGVGSTGRCTLTVLDGQIVSVL